MSRSSEPGERAQHSVAELLARYGETAPSTGRRRRRAPEDHNTAPQSIIERVQTDSGPFPGVERRGRRHSGESDVDSLAAPRRGLHDRDAGPAAFDSHSWTDRGGAAAGHVNGHSGSNGFNGPGSDGYSSGDGYRGNGHHGVGAYWSGGDRYEDNWMGLPPVGAGPEPLNGRTLSAGPITDRLPRLDPIPQTPAPDAPVADDPPTWPGLRPLSGEPAAGLGVAGLATSTQTVAWKNREDLRVDDHQQAPDVASAPGGVGHSAPAQLGQAEVDDQVPELAHDPAEAQPASPVREWVVMATQIGVGVIGGAVLWLICEWLWQRLPVAALVVALAVITGLVWVVRHVRRAEDLQTTVIAVLVGLFVTVSPAALLLVGR